MFRPIIPASALFLVLLQSAAHADEGMWTFDNFPLADGQPEIWRCSIDQSWLDRVRGASVRLSTGCSASIVSGRRPGADQSSLRARLRPAALHRRPSITSRTASQVAKREDEKLCPGMQADVLTTISDVTDRVTKAAAGKTGQDFVKARDAEIAAVEKEGCAGKRGQVPLPGHHALSGRPVQALHLSQIFRCAAGVRAGRHDRFLRRRSRQFQFSPLRPRLLLRAALRGRQARHRRRII